MIIFFFVIIAIKIDKFLMQYHFHVDNQNIFLHENALPIKFDVKMLY